MSVSNRSRETESAESHWRLDSSDADLMNRLTERLVGSSVSELEHLLDKREEGGFLHMPLPHDELIGIFGDTAAFRLGMVPMLLVGSSDVHGIVAAVRDAILAWSLELEQRAFSARP